MKHISKVVNVSINDVCKELYGITRTEALKKGICVRCKQKAEHRSEEGRREYRISGLCEPCFDRTIESIEKDQA